MPGRIARTARADDDLVRIAAYLILEDQSLAMRFLRAAAAAFHQLATFPQMGSRYRSHKPALAEIRKGPIPEFPKPLIFYRSIKNGVQIVRELHGIRGLEPLLENDHSE